MNSLFATCTVHNFIIHNFVYCCLRSQVNSVYRKKFATVDVEIHYSLTLVDSLAELVIDKRPSKPKPVVESENENSRGSA